MSSQSSETCHLQCFLCHLQITPPIPTHLLPIDEIHLLKFRLQPCNKNQYVKISHLCSIHYSYIGVDLLYHHTLCPWQHSAICLIYYVHGEMSFQMAVVSSPYS